MHLTLTLNDSDETIRCAAEAVSGAARWQIAAAAIKAWVDETPAEEAAHRYAGVVQALNGYQRRELAKRHGLPWDASAAELSSYFVLMADSKRTALMAAAVLWAQQEARGEDGLDHLLDQVVPTLTALRLEQLAGEVLGIYALAFRGSLN